MIPSPLHHPSRQHKTFTASFVWPARLVLALRRAFTAITCIKNFKSFFFTLLCLKAWVFEKFGLQSVCREVVLDLKPVRLCIDVARLELISFWEIWDEGIYDAIDIDNPRCVVDVGANIGVFSLYQSILKRADEVVAFEPSSEVFQRLLKNIEINGIKNVRAVNVAVGNEIGTLSFSQSRISANSQVSETGPIKVPCVRLDDELKDVAIINILKIDTEGYEVHVLRGASQTLEKTERIALELHYPGERQQIETILSPLGFSLVKANGSLVFYRKGPLSSGPKVPFPGESNLEKSAN